MKHNKNIPETFVDGVKVFTDEYCVLTQGSVLTQPPSALVSAVTLDETTLHNSKPAEEFELVEMQENSVSSHDDITHQSGAFDELTNEDVVERNDLSAISPNVLDTYDKIFIKLKQGNTPLLFTEMKSISDFLKTSDYAEKVFMSRTASQSLSDYKVYLGITLVTLLIILVACWLEYKAVLIEIDKSLGIVRIDTILGDTKKLGVQLLVSEYAKSNYIVKRSIGLSSSIDSLSNIASKRTDVRGRISQGSDDIKLSVTKNGPERTELAVLKNDVVSSQVEMVSVIIGTDIQQSKLELEFKRRLREEPTSLYQNFSFPSLNNSLEVLNSTMVKKRLEHLNQL